MSIRYDALVIGSGAAGGAAARALKSAGLSVAMAESGDFGGTCALRGCEPKKVLAENGVVGFALWFAFVGYCFWMMLRILRFGSLQVEDALTAIEQRSTQTVDAVEDIARAADEQSRAGHDIARKVESVAHLAGTIGSQTREVEDVAGDLAAQVAGLSDAAARFRR